jgi:copper chaperone
VLRGSADRELGGAAAALDTRVGYTADSMGEITYTVSGMHCGHCVRAVKEELERIPGVEHVAVDLEAKLVTVGGDDLEDAQLRAGIAEAGYEAE